MSEISREDVIKELKSFPVSYLDFEEQKALNRAISDMQKLEKIEQLIKSNRTNPLVDCGMLLSEIEQILRGDEE